MGAGESILGASIGSGVAAGASTALGNSTAGHFISGVAGGVVGRAAGRAAANRRTRPQGTTEEQIPLLGNRLGGRRGRSRLVQETQQTNDPITGENTTWQIPEYQSIKTSQARNKLISKMNRKAERQEQADRLSKVLSQVNQENATTKIQKVVRGHKIRKQLPEIIEEYDRQQMINKINDVEQKANKIDKAAFTIQKRFRQNKRKTTPITISNEPPTTTIQPANLIADSVSRNVVKKSMNNIIRKQQTAAAATLQSAMRRKTKKI
jgi:hypothetical protein